MIYTITYNPAIDLVIKVDDCTLGDLNRSQKEDYVPGGKGINMSIILKRLGVNNIATGFLGGFSGKYIEEALLNEAIDPKFVEVDGITRINVKLKSNQETEINAAGPVISTEQFEKLYQYFNQVLEAGDTVFLAGNAAPGLDEQAYIRIAQLCLKKKVLFILDSNKQLLSACLVYHPFLIKPNHHELGELFNVNIQTQDDIIQYAMKLQALGARNVLVSCGGEGALLLTETQKIYTSNIPTGKLVNSVGAGDSMLAGFMAKYIETQDYAQSLQQGAATGSATAYSVGLATKDQIEKLISQIIITEIN